MVMDQGMTGSSAGSTALLASSLFQGQDNMALAGMGPQILSTLGNSRNFLAIIGARMGLHPDEVMSALSAQGPEATLRAIMGEVGNIAKQYQSLPPQVAAQNFANRMRSYGLNLSRAQAEVLMNEALSGDSVSAAVSDYNSDSGIQVGSNKVWENTPRYVSSTGYEFGTNFDPSDIQNVFKYTGQAVGASWRNAGLGLRVAGSAVSSLFGGDGRKADWDQWYDDYQANESAAWQSLRFDVSNEYDIPLLTEAVRNYGLDDLYYTGPQGKTRALRDLDTGSRSEMEKIANGTYRIGSYSSGTGAMTLRDFSSSGAAAEALASGGQFTLGLTPEAARLVQTMNGGRPTQHQEQSMRGENGALPNNAPSGDR